MHSHDDEITEIPNPMGTPSRYNGIPNTSQNDAGNLYPNRDYPVNPANQRHNGTRNTQSGDEGHTCQKDHHVKSENTGVIPHVKTSKIQRAHMGLEQDHLERKMEPGPMGNSEHQHIIDMMRHVVDCKKD